MEGPEKPKGCNPPVLLLIASATLISTAASLAGGLVMYFQGLSSLKDAVRHTSLTELHLLHDQIDSVMVHTEEINTLMKTFLYSTERVQGSDTEVWGNLTRAFVFSLIKSNTDMYGGGVVLVPWDITDSSAFSASVWGNPTQRGGKHFTYGIYASHLPPSSFVVDNTTLPPTLERMDIHTSLLHNETGEVQGYAYQLDGKIHVTTLGDFDPRLGGKPAAPLWEDVAPSGQYQPPVARKWRKASVWHTDDSFTFTYTANDMVFVPPPHPHPWASYRAVVVFNAVMFRSWSEILALYAVRHHDTTVVVLNPVTEEIVSSTTGHQMVQDCLAPSGLMSSCPTKIHTMPVHVQEAFRKTRGSRTGIFETLDLDGSQYFVRWHDAGFKGYTMLWLRPTSSVEGKVQEALVLLIIFTVLVLVFDLIVSLSEVVFIALPLRRLSQATLLIGVLETAQATRTLEHYQQAGIMVKEMRALMDGMLGMTKRLEEYKTFMPEAIFACDSMPAIQPAGAGDPPGRETGHAAVMFTDIKGSTALWEKCPDGMAAGLRVHNTVIRQQVSKFGGYEVKTIGDAFMVAFEDLDNAVECALAVQEVLGCATWPESLLELPQVAECAVTGYRGLRVRIGCTAGAMSVELNEVMQRYDYFGPTVNRAARLESQGMGGGVVVEVGQLEELCAVRDGNAVVAPLGQRTLKGIGDVRLALLVPGSMGQAPDVQATTPKEHNPLSGRSSTTSIASWEESADYPPPRGN